MLAAKYLFFLRKPLVDPLLAGVFATRHSESRQPRQERSVRQTKAQWVTQTRDSQKRARYKRETQNRVTGGKREQTQTLTCCIAAQALLVQSALSIMRRQQQSTDPGAQRPSARSDQLSSRMEVTQLRAEYEARMAAAVEKAQAVRTRHLAHCQRWQSSMSVFVSVPFCPVTLFWVSLLYLALFWLSLAAC